MKIVLEVITKNKKILIGKVKKNKIEDFGEIEYTFPGGQIQRKEDEKEALKREVKEETGLNVQITRKIGQRIHPKTNIITLYYHCKVMSGKEYIKSSKNDDIDKLLWVRKEKLEKYMPTVFKKVKKYLVET